MCGRQRSFVSSEPSEESLDVYIPSFPGSPRSLSLNEDSVEIEKDLEKGVSLIYTKTEIEAREEDFILTAAETGDNQALARCIKDKANINAVDHLGRNALHFAVQNGNMQAIEMLLRAGINAALKDNVGMTPLMLCLMRNPSLEVCRLLFENGVVILPRAKPMDTGIFIQYVMMCTPTPEDAKILRLLVENGALVNDPGAPGQRQALHCAAMSNNCDLIQILLDLGADPQARNHRNETPKDVAQIFKCKEAAALLASIEEISTVPSTVPSDATVTTGDIDDLEIKKEISRKLSKSKRRVKIS